MRKGRGSALEKLSLSLSLSLSVINVADKRTYRTRVYMACSRFKSIKGPPSPLSSALLPLLPSPPSLFPSSSSLSSESVKVWLVCSSNRTKPSNDSARAPSSSSQKSCGYGSRLYGSLSRSRSVEGMGKLCRCCCCFCRLLFACGGDGDDGDAMVKVVTCTSYY